METAKIIPFPQKTAHMLVPGSVTFRAPFMLPGLDQPHRPGTFAVRETRQPLDVSWPAFVSSLTLILVDGGTTQALDVAREDLDAALMRDIGARGA